MGFREEIAETARRLATKDDWYYKGKEPYILEMRSVPGISGLPGPAGQQFLIFPLGPENYKVSRVFRQSVTPTLGGLVAEERGMLWRQISISGTFGFAPKSSVDTSLGPDPTLVVLGVGVLSGPAWTRRLMRNFFDKYGELKADPQTANQTELIWHDTRTGDSWVVVPENVDIDRTVARRGQYPYSLQLKAIGKAQLQFPIPPLSAGLNALGKIGKAIAAVSKALALVNSAIQEASAILGEVRFFIAQIDSIIDKLTVIATSAQAFVDGVTRTISVGAAFISSTTALLQATLNTMETIADLPDTVRQTYQMALDGLDQMAAQISAFGETYQDAADPIATSEAGVARESTETLAAAAAAGPQRSAALQAQARTRATDEDLNASGALATGRTFASYSGFSSYTITSTDTLTSIAAVFLGDGALWYDIALVNGLQPPYISQSGAPGTVKVGDTISIPQVAANGTNAIVSGQGSEPGENLLGTDVALRDSAYSAPGRPSVDIAIDRGTFSDVRTVSGFANLAQALQLRIWTERGSMPLSPGYGIPRVIGVKQTGAFLALLRIAYEQTVRQDSRVQNIGAVRFEVVDDLIEVDLDVISRGSTSSRTLSTALV
jgi:hypothetical protein